MVRAQDCYHVKKLAVRFYSMKQNPSPVESLRRPTRYGL